MRQIKLQRVRPIHYDGRFKLQHLIANIFLKLFLKFWYCCKQYTFTSMITFCLFSLYYDRLLIIIQLLSLFF